MPAAATRHLSSVRRRAPLLGVVALPLLMLFPSAAGWMTAPLIGGGLVLAVREHRLTPIDWEFLLATAALPLAYAVNMALFGGGLNLLERPGHLLRAFLIYYAVSRLGLSRASLTAGLALAALTACGIALYETRVLHEARVFGFRGHWNAVPFGNFSLLLGLLCGLAALWPWRQARMAWKLVAACAGAAGLAASLLSGSRGGWITLPVLLPALAWLHPTPLPRRLGTVVVILGLLAVAGLGTLPAVQARLTEGVTEVLAYCDRPDDTRTMSTSVGQRLAMWRWGLQRFGEHPVAGFGFANFPAERAAAVRRGELPGAVESMKLANVHNELIGTLAGGGILTAAGLLAFWIAGWRFFCKRLGAGTDESYFAACGLLVLLATGLFSMTEGLFGTGPGTKALMLLLALPAAGLAQRERIRQVPSLPPCH